MTIPVLVSSSNDQFVAVPAGTPEVCGEGASPDAAIRSLKAELARRMQQGRLVWVDFEPLQNHDVIGSFADDETLSDLCAEIYRERNAELAP